MSDPFWIKYKKITLQNAITEHVSSRLKRLTQSPPLGIPQLYQFGFTEDHLWLKLQFIEGINLIQFIEQLAPAKLNYFYKHFYISGIHHLNTWEHQNFVHGDLSPRNIMIDLNWQLYFIDYSINLHAPEGTPQYFSKFNLKKGKSPRYDQLAFKKILAEIDSLR